MINVCNIFKPIDIETGNFLLFSQYTRDLARSVSDAGRKVRPSRFVCMNIDSDNISYAQQKTLLSGIDSLPGWFQNEFENGIAEARNNNITVEGHNFSMSFWGKLIEICGTEKNVGDDERYVDEFPGKIVYDGIIDVESWSEGFADILLNISSGSIKKETKYNTDVINPDTFADFVQAAGIYNYTPYQTYISGWSEGEIPINGSISQNPHMTFLGDYKNGEHIEDSVIDTGDGKNSICDRLFKFTPPTPDPEDPSKIHSFTFNTVIVMYDVLDDNNVIIEKDIPMGIYFTGTVINNQITNPVTIYDSSNDAYGAGSGWSLRISTRFSPTPQGYLKVEEVAVESGALDSSISALMGANAETMKILQTYISNSAIGYQKLQDTLNIFKNGRTNVPYIREVNGAPYWFVNGRNTEVPVYPD